MDGKVVGLTTFGEGATGGGISGIVRIEAAALLLDRARAKMRELTPPTAKLLPVDPPGSYPVDALKSSLETKKFDETPYEFREGAWDIAVVTPILKYHLSEACACAAEGKRKAHDADDTGDRRDVPAAGRHEGLGRNTPENTSRSSRSR